MNNTVKIGLGIVGVLAVYFLFIKEKDNGDTMSNATGCGCGK